jgi:hypothetical protein
VQDDVAKSGCSSGNHTGRCMCRRQHNPKKFVKNYFSGKRESVKGMDRWKGEGVRLN